jgi:hypothetical protein
VCQLSPQLVAGQIKDLLNQYIIEASSGQYDYVKALAEFASRDESALNFKKGDIIAVVPKHDAYTEKVPQDPFIVRLFSYLVHLFLTLPLTRFTHVMHSPTRKLN